MQAIILAAGQGTRLRPFTVDTPKCLAPVLGRPLLEIQLAVLKTSGVAPVNLIGGHKAFCLKKYGHTLLHSPNYATTNMVWTLRCAFERFREGCILAYGDIVYSPAVLEKLLRHPGDICVVVDDGWEAYWKKRFAAPFDDAETLRIDADGFLAEIGNRPESLDAVQGQYIGLMKFSPQGASAVCEAVESAVGGRNLLNGKAVEKAYMTDLLQHLITAGQHLHAVHIDGEWAEIDSPSDIPAAEERIRGWAAPFLARMGDNV